MTQLLTDSGNSNDDSHSGNRSDSFWDINISHFVIRITNQDFYSAFKIEIKCKIFLDLTSND